MNWKRIENQLVVELNFNTFLESWAFATQVALLAERHQHHPNIIVAYNKLTLTLTTHDEGNTITKKDEELAAAISKLKD